MSSNEKGGRLDLRQFYSQLEKYQKNDTSMNSSKSRLRKDNSTSSFNREALRETPLYTKETSSTVYKDQYRNTPSSTLYKATFLPERQKITINDKPTLTTKPIIERFESSVLDSLKKNRVQDERMMNAESLVTSAISKKWPTENAEEKENLSFTQKEEQAFTDHCTQLYRLRHSPSLVQDISREVNKRDQLYQLVAGQFPQVPQQRYVQTLKRYFQEYELMQSVITEFKNASNCRIDDLQELYYLLKSDRE